MQPGVVCLVLHVCWRARLVDDYAHALARWDAAPLGDVRAFFVDSCRPPSNASHPHPLETARVRRLPFTQRKGPHDRFYLTPYEVAQMRAAVATLPSECTHVAKLTGKYHSDDLASELARMASLPGPWPLLTLSARGRSYHGWASELFVMARQLMAVQLEDAHAHTRTELWLEHVRQTVLACNGTTRVLPRMPLSRAVRRSGDGQKMSWL